MPVSETSLVPLRTLAPPASIVTCHGLARRGLGLRRARRQPRGARWVLLACVTVMGLLGARSARALSGPEHGLGATESRVRSEALPNAPGQSLTIVRVTYAPGGTSPRHHHAGTVLAVVLSGAVRSQNSATGPVRVYRAGDSFFEPPGSHHTVSENASATEPAELLAIFVAPEGAQLTAADP